MAFRIPDTVFAPEHFGDGRNAPNCQIRVFFDCAPTFCTAGEMMAEIIEASSGDVLARGPVSCNGVPTIHRYQLLAPSPLRAIIAQTRFTCGEDQDKQDGDTDRIWIRCA